jgi:Mini-chromosome maintenance replisome factor
MSFDSFQECTLTSNRLSRSPPLLPLSLALSGFNLEVQPLVDVVSQLVPLCTTLPLSLHNVNNTGFYPESKDEDLHSGWLQLPKGSLCIVSELALTEGTISERGGLIPRMECGGRID